MLIATLPPTQNSFYNQLYKQKKSEKFFKVFYDRMRLAQQEIRATVSVNMFELSCRKRDDDSDISGFRFKKGTVENLTLLCLNYNQHNMAPLKNTLAVWDMQQTTVSKVKVSKEGLYKVKTNSWGQVLSTAEHFHRNRP